DSYKDVLENPDRISKAVLAKGLDSNTAFEILSIDIADVDVGDNIGAKLQSEQADADKRIAQAKAEVRRAAAVAVEQEMKAKTQETRAQVVEPEAQLAIANVSSAIERAGRNRSATHPKISGSAGTTDYVQTSRAGCAAANRSTAGCAPARRHDEIAASAADDTTSRFATRNNITRPNSSDARSENFSAKR